MRLFGTDHIAALVVTAICCAVAVAVGRRLRGTPTARIAGRSLALVLLAAQIADPFIAHDLGWLRWNNSLPIELCDAASFAVMVALWGQRQLAFELAYFWGLAGTVQAIVTPDLGDALAFPHPEFVRFFVLHIGIVAGVFYLGPGLGMRPRRGAEYRVLGMTLAYAGLVGIVNWALDANYMYLCVRPTASPLDWFGPWPWYLVGATAMAAVMFSALALPYRFSRSGGS